MINYPTPTPDVCYFIVHKGDADWLLADGKIDSMNRYAVVHSAYDAATALMYIEHRRNHVVLVQNRHGLTLLNERG